MDSIVTPSRWIKLRTGGELANLLAELLIGGPSVHYSFCDYLNEKMKKFQLRERAQAPAVLSGEERFEISQIKVLEHILHGAYAVSIVNPSSEFSNLFSTILETYNNRHGYDVFHPDSFLGPDSELRRLIINLTKETFPMSEGMKAKIETLRAYSIIYEDKTIESYVLSRDIRKDDVEINDGSSGNNRREDIFNVEEVVFCNGKRGKISQVSYLGLMGDPRHYSYDALNLLTLTKEVMEEREILQDLIVVALKLPDYQNLKERVKTLHRSLREDLVLKKPLLTQMCSTLSMSSPCLLNSAEKELKFELETLQFCLTSAVTALNVLAGPNQRKEIDKMQELLKGYTKCSPLAWEGMFKGAYNIAIFLKYAARESMREAYKQLRLLNFRDVSEEDFSDDQKRLDHLIKHAQFILPEAIVSSEDIKMILNDMSPTADVYESALRKLEMTGDELCLRRGENDSEGEICTSETEVGKLMYLLSVTWVKHNNRGYTTKVFLPPRNIQLVNVLCITEWIRLVLSGDCPEIFKANAEKGKCLVAQVGTGEGKSLTIAFVVAYCVKVLGKKVHVLENNAGLLEKDFAQFELFYADLGIVLAMADENTPGPPKDPDPKLVNADVIYFTNRAMQTIYKHGVGKYPFQNTVLIVDEVDDLIVDRDPNSLYGIPHEQRSGDVQKCFKQLLDGNKTMPQGVDRSIWEECKSARKIGEKKDSKKGDYGKSGEKFVLQINGTFNPNAYCLWLEWINFRESRGSYKPEYHVNYFVQCIPHVMNAYDCIVGLSGSLGSTKEKEFLRDIYGAWSYLVPPFLSTCIDDNKRVIGKTFATLQNDEVMIYGTRQEQYAAVVELAIQKSEKVPVLIICPWSDNPVNTRNDLKSLCQQITDALANKKRTRPSLFGNCEPEEFVQWFAEQGDDNKKMDYNAKVRQATKEYDEVSLRCITVSDPFGGRGFDFDVRDQHADRAGGMLVIAMHVPPERDWIQWKGRTARGDRKGQLAVYLTDEDTPLNPLAGALNGDSAIRHRTGSNKDGKKNHTIIDEILKFHDKGVGEKLSIQKEKTAMGQRLNEFCDFYHENFPPPESRASTIKRWPRPECTDKDNALSDFLKSLRNSSREIKEFKQRITNSDYESKYPHSTGIYFEPPTAPAPKYVAFLVDYSHSMSWTDGGSKPRIDNAIDCVLEFFNENIAEKEKDKFDGDSVSFTLFDTSIKEVFAKTVKTKENASTLYGKIDRSRIHDGGTYFLTALMNSIDKISLSSSNNWIIALTDGATSDERKLDDLKQRINDRDNINLFLIGFGPDVAKKDSSVWHMFEDIKNEFKAKEEEEVFAKSLLRRKEKSWQINCQMPPT